MTEWVIRKDTELSSLSHSPVRGDAASLAKQLVSRRILHFHIKMALIDYEHIHLCDNSLPFRTMIDVLPISHLNEMPHV